VLVAFQRTGEERRLPAAAAHLVGLLRSWGPGPDHLTGLALAGITVPSRLGPRFVDALVFTRSGVVVIAAHSPGVSPGSAERAGAGVAAAKGALAAHDGGRYVTGLVAVVPHAAVPDAPEPVVERPDRLAEPVSPGSAAGPPGLETITVPAPREPMAESRSPAGDSAWHEPDPVWHEPDPGELEPGSAWRVPDQGDRAPEQTWREPDQGESGSAWREQDQPWDERDEGGAKPSQTWGEPPPGDREPGSAWREQDQPWSERDQGGAKPSQTWGEPPPGDREPGSAWREQDQPWSERDQGGAKPNQPRSEPGPAWREPDSGEPAPDQTRDHLDPPWLGTDSFPGVAVVLADPRGLRRIIGQHNRWRTVWSADDVLDACYALSLAHLAPPRAALLADGFPARLPKLERLPVLPAVVPLPPDPPPAAADDPGPRTPGPRGHSVFPRQRPIRQVPWGLVFVLTVLVTVGVIAAVFVAQVFHGS
jgi:hypothetical protein